ncbi:MAG: alpha-L-rhamnosidase [Cytophagales bacterium]|nr:MAG: alpha-L-rhamnosidase [Cytophagales bacterium]
MKKNYCFWCLIFILSNTSLTHAQLTTEINPQLVNKVWSAKWIQHTYNNDQFGVYHFRKSFSLKAIPNKFIIHISADNRYWLFVNGKRICTGSSKGDLKHWQFESLDLAPYLSLGKNTLAIAVWNFGEFRPASQFTAGTGLVVQGNSELEQVANTDTTWLVCENTAYTPVFENHKYIGAREIFFGPRSIPKWEMPQADERNFKKAILADNAVPISVDVDSKRKLIQRIIPLPEEKEERFANIRNKEENNIKDDFIKGIGAQSFGPWANNSILIDLEHLTTAYPEIKVSGGKGARITLTYMEAPFINVKQEYKGNRSEVKGKIIDGVSDVFYPNGDTDFVYRPLTYRTFRYIEIKLDNYQDQLVIKDFKTKFTAYPFEEKASFKSNDKSLADIWRVAWRTARLCAYDTYMDCPYYEQFQYIGDTRIQALVSLYMSGDDRLMRNAIQQFYNSQNSEGLTQSRYPNWQNQIIPPFSLFWVLMIHDHWLHKGDAAFAKQFSKGIENVLAWHISRIDSKTGMLGVLEHWNFVDWPKDWPWLGIDQISGVPKGTEKGNTSIHTLQLVMVLQKSADLFKDLGYSIKAKEYLSIANHLKTNTYKNCWDENKNLLADHIDKSNFSQHANVLATITELSPKINYKELMNKTVKDTNLVQCTVYWRFYLNQAMKKAGLGNQYIEMLTPWHNMLSLGLTTFAEKPEPSRSDCHGWSASPNYDLLATVLGVNPASAGFKTVNISPNLGELTFAEGTIPHPNGNISVKLKKTNLDGIDAEISLPKDISGVFVWKGEKVKLNGGNQIIKIK